MTAQDQFLDVIDREEATRRFQEALRLAPIGEEQVLLVEALGRVLARDITAPLDVPSFDRSNFDGFAVVARDTFGADEEAPRPLRLAPEVLAAGTRPQLDVQSGLAIAVMTGAMLPRGADAVVMVEHTEIEGDTLLVRRGVTPGAGVTFAGTDIGAGETVLRRGERLTSRETGVLAAIGVASVPVWRRPRVAILSTGDEVIAPGTAMTPGKIYDSNSRIVADAVRELGGDPVFLGIVRDDVDLLRRQLHLALESCDAVLMSGGTSKGQGDLSYRVVRELLNPGVVAHGVALKPGKPICLAAEHGKPVVVLPGFPTSAIFTFHEFVAPVLTRLCGASGARRGQVTARLAVKVNSEIGRTEYVLVGLVRRSEAGAGEPELAAYPMGKGSGSVTAFSRADGFVTVARHEEIVEAGTVVDVQLLGRELHVADLIVIGSHCIGLDFLLGQLQAAGLHTKFLAVGSTAGLEAARRGECDLAGIHLLDPRTGEYNRPYVGATLALVPGYGRIQGVVFRRGDPRFEGLQAQQAIDAIKHDPACLMVNRNQGSGTRILTDQLLNGVQPAGYAVQAKNHNAVAAAVAQHRADWGVAIRSAADQQQLGFLPLTEERFDFVVPQSRLTTPAIIAFRELLERIAIRQQLAALGFMLDAAATTTMNDNDPGGS